MLENVALVSSVEKRESAIYLYISIYLSIYIYIYCLLDFLPVYVTTDDLICELAANLKLSVGGPGVNWNLPQGQKSWKALFFTLPLLH